MRHVLSDRKTSMTLGLLNRPYRFQLYVVWLAWLRSSKAFTYWFFDAGWLTLLPCGSTRLGREDWIRSHCRILNSNIMDICWTRSYTLGYWSVQRFVKIKSASLVFLFVTLLPLVSLWSFGSSTISNQLVAGSIIVRHIKSILEPSLPLRVYGPIRSTHNAAQGVVMASLGGTWPYFWLCLLFTWQDLQDLIYFGWYVSYLSNTSRISTFPQDVSAQGAGGSGDTNWQPCAVEMLEWPICLPCKALWCLQ